MSNHPLLTVAGQVTDLFGHRFVLSTSSGKVLADLGPKGSGVVTLAAGDVVTLTGEQNSSEMKVHSIVRGGHTIVLKSGKEDRDIREANDAKAAAAVRAAGFEPVGPAKRKPKHVEILGRRGEEYVDFHIGPDGHIRHSRPAEGPKREERA